MRSDQNLTSATHPMGGVNFNLNGLPETGTKARAGVPCAPAAQSRLRPNPVLRRRRRAQPTPGDLKLINRTPMGGVMSVKVVIEI